MSVVETLKCSLGGHSRSLEMQPFDRRYTTFYWSAIVSTVPSCTVIELVDVENIVTLTSGLEVTQGY